MRRGAIAALAVIAALAAAGCTEKREDYATPSELCGIPIDPAVLRPVLLPGEKLTATSGNSNEKTRRCLVRVDGEPILSLQSGTEPPDENYRAMWDWQMPQGTAVNIGDEGRAIDVYVAAAQKCAVEGEQRLFLAHAERFHPKKDDATARQEALVRFMTAFFPAAKTAASCTG